MALQPVHHFFIGRKASFGGGRGGNRAPLGSRPSDGKRESAPKTRRAHAAPPCGQYLPESFSAAPLESPNPFGEASTLPRRYTSFRRRRRFFDVTQRFFAMAPAR